MNKINKQTIRSHFDRYFERKCTHQDLEELYHWINNESNKSELGELVVEYAKKQNVVNIDHLPNEEEIIWNQISAKLNITDLTEVNNNIVYNGKQSIGKYQILKIAAMVAILVMSSVISWKLINSNDQLQSHDFIAQTIIKKETQPGEKLTVRLLDGSIVKLNGSSSLEYGTDFNRTDRKLTLTGEAFFEVAKDEIRHFRVTARNIVTTAVGTSFNISAYPYDQKIEVSLATGKVRVDQTREDNSIENTDYLNPGEQLKYENHVEPTKSSFDPSDVLAWKDGIISFSNADQQGVISKLENWYGVKIMVENATSSDWDITAKFDNQTLENVIKSISYTLDFEYYILDKEILIKF